MKSLGFDAIVWGGTGWNALWSFGVAQFFLDTGFECPKKIGVISGGCLPGLSFIGAADQQMGIVQCEQLYNHGDFLFNDRFRRRYRRYMESFVNQDCMETLKDYDFYSTYTKIPSCELVKDNNHTSRKDLLDKITAGCHIPFLLGTNIPLFHKNNYIIDVLDFRKTWWTFPAHKTLVISPSEKSTDTIIGGNMGILNTIGIRKNITDKDIFLKGYKDAAEWLANIRRDEAWKLKENWRIRGVKPNP